MDLTKWWAGLKISEKERIATKILEHESNVKGDPTYPHCTNLWEILPEDRKEAVYHHCVFKHGQLEKIDFDGEPYTD